jgi:hypothetical protein
MLLNDILVRSRSPLSTRIMRTLSCDAIRITVYFIYEKLCFDPRWHQSGNRATIGALSREFA